MKREVQDEDLSARGHGESRPTLDRRTFLRPIAHRGLHGLAAGCIENTAPAFEAAMAHGYGIECDLRPASDGTPFVFHDATLDRLIEGAGAIAVLAPAAIRRLVYRTEPALRIIELAELLDLVAGRVPLLIEIKSEWEPPDRNFLRRIAAAASTYKGPLALMSFDPAQMAAVRMLAPDVPRGIVSGLYQGEGWWLDRLGKERAERLSHLLESASCAPSFYSYHVDALPTPVTRFVREVIGLPLFAWTVRTEHQRALAAAWADAPTFEGYEP